MASKRDELARRLSDKLQKAPPRGQAISGKVSAPTVESIRTPTSSTSPPDVGRLARGSAGGRLRGHLVPRSLHAEARRLKLAQASSRGRRVTWDDVAREAVQLLLAQRVDTVKRLADVRRLHAEATSGPRLVQATIPVELDRLLAEFRLDLADELGRDVPYEQLWSAALLMWVRHSR